MPVKNAALEDANVSPYLPVGVPRKAAQRLGLSNSSPINDDKSWNGNLSATSLRDRQSSAAISTIATTTRRTSVVDRFSLYLNETFNLAHYISPAQRPYSNKAHAVLGIVPPLLQVTQEPSSKRTRHAQSILNSITDLNTQPRRASIVGYVKPHHILYENSDTLEHRSSRIPDGAL